MTTFQCMYCGESKHYSAGIVLEIKVGDHVELEAFLCDDCYSEHRGKY